MITANKLYHIKASVLGTPPKGKTNFNGSAY
jgi:hypothetical protein